MTGPRPGRRAAALLPLVLLAGLGGAAPPDPRVAPVPAGRSAGAPAARADSTGAVIRRLADGTPLGGLTAARWRYVQHLYAARRHAPLWLAGGAGGAALDARAAALLDTVANAPAQGLPAGAYPWDVLGQALEALRADRASAEARARADVLLTTTFVAYATDLLTGHVDPDTVTQEWHIDPQAADVDSVLARALRPAGREAFAAALAGLRPPDPDYGPLVGALVRYRGLAAAGGWAELEGAATLHPGDTASAAVVEALRARLRAEGYVAGATPATNAATARRTAVRRAAARRTAADSGGAAGRRVRVDAALAGAVADFQRRHGLAADSVLGPNTRAAFNKSAEYRAGQIGANLERHRWMPHERGGRSVLVNVPAFRLRAYDDGREALAMNVIVGAEYDGRSTPVFADSMAYVVFRPYWNVPSGIAERELWPKQRASGSYFARNGYEVVNASWGRYVRQKPGPGNALGFVKFIFPNDFNIYLHDTPERHLFDEASRARSHGCIRVQHPAALAAWVLGPQGWDSARVDSAMQHGADDRRVNLERKVPVYITYFTAYTRGGALYFADDVYGRDAALIRALGGAGGADADRAGAAAREAARALGA